MEVSGIAYCAENKRLSFSPFPIMSTGTLLHKSSDMGVHHHSKEMPFVEITGHKVSEPIVHQTFQINKFPDDFGIAERIHFTTNAKNLMRSESIFQRKDLYGSHFQEISLSQLVGGFVGSKSQIGSSSKETHLIWDIIFGKLVEFCGTHHNPNCYTNIGSVLSQQVLDSFRHKGTSAPVSSNCVIQSSVSCNRSTIGEKSSDQKSISPHNTSNCNQPSTSDISKQSYAEVAKIFAINHQKSKTLPSIMPRKKNPLNRRNLTRGQFTCSTANNWRIRCNPSVKEFRNHARFFSGGKNRPDNNRNYKPPVNFEKECKTEERRKENWRSTANSRKVNRPSEKDPKKMTSNTVQTNIKEATPQEVLVGGNDSCTEGKQEMQLSPRRGRCSSECSTVSVAESTASDDSFVIFDSEAEPVECMLEIDFSDDECFTDSSDEDDSDGSDYEEDDVPDCSAIDKPVSLEPERERWKVFLSNLAPEMVELNLKWRKENSCVPSEEKIPVKICFADEVEVHEMDTWNEEYHEARISIWMQLALDHERFQKRIKDLESVLAPVLTHEHRDHIWRERFSSMSADT